MTILCLTGWQQRYDALAEIAPDGVQFDYTSYSDSAKMFAALPVQPDVAIGWSLGGQLLVRAIAAGYVKPHKLVLLAANYQCVADEHFTVAMSKQDFTAVREQYAANPRAMLAQFQAVVGFGHRDIIRRLSRDVELWQHGLYWLDELGTFSCREIDFSNFPETIIVHGMEDRVADIAHAQAFAERIDGSQLVLLPGMSHALHLHDPKQIRSLASV